MRLVTGPAGASATRTSSRSPSGTVPSLPHAPARRVRCAFKTEEQKRRYTDIDEALPPITSPITGLPPRSKTEQLASEPIIDENEWTLSRQERTKLAVARVKVRDVIDHALSFAACPVPLSPRQVASASA